MLIFLKVYSENLINNNMDIDKMIYDSIIKDGFFDALQKTETGGQSKPDEAVGDKGESIGSLQIQENYFNDAMLHYNKDMDLQKTFPELKKMTYNNVKDRDTAQKIVYVYAKKYEPELLQKKDYKSIARLHNGGPTWNRQYDTKYIYPKKEKTKPNERISIGEYERVLWKNALQFSDKVMNNFTGAN